MGFQTRLLPFRLFCLCGLMGLLVAACEEPVDLGIEIEEPQLVISSNFFPQERVKVRVTATQSILTGGVTTIDIRNAEVSLFEGHTMAEKLMYVAGDDNNPGTYQTMEFRPVVGKDYTLHVAAPGFVPVNAQSSIPDPVPIKNLSVRHLTSNSVDGQTIYDYKLLVDYEDPPGEENYYDLRITQLVTPYVIAYNGDTIKMQPQTVPIKYLVDPNPDDFNVSRSILFQDKPDPAGVELSLQSVIDPAQVILGDLVAELRTVSIDYYEFQRSLARNQQVPTGGINEPTLIYNNVRSGVGIFAGYNSVSESVSLPR
ncbi:DUF4249 domain-containing protein [Lewinella sp. W8]|uniref:DUF4249 domain-containing protein n=1 Tax=Lewinella sp. W8 TaxID=2528208 RepID=UPI0010672A78|nr:DUF4249 domain-containing protein [Lewinella sp. W8]MTB51358.1 DUF4249 family protein [Lewinella sp. W8]